MDDMTMEMVVPDDQPDTEIERAIRRVASDLHRLNHSVTKAVEAGATVELLRCSRFHCGNGRWGDQMVPVVKLVDTPAP
jgi:hypothetical protein